jgi:DNA (cytosine-5)-methyltransferase 1
MENFNAIFIKHNSSLNTITANGKFIDFETPQHISDDAIKMGGSYPMDYDFKTNKVVYLVGMSVPPVMTAQIAKQVYEQWLSKI